MSEDLLKTTDAHAWAKEFVRLHGGDEGLMVTWFANMWAATYDPLQARIERLETALRDIRVIEQESLNTERIDTVGYASAMDRIARVLARVEALSDERR